MRIVVAVVILLAMFVVPARAQVFNHINPDHLNQKLQGRVVEFTNNHGADRRIFSPILGMPRDLYVYLPPGYDASKSYPLVIFLHGADIDEHAILDPAAIKPLDFMIAQGNIPPLVLAAPDGTYDGKNHISSTHSLWVNGNGGRFADHITDEVLPLMLQMYSIRPEREAHAMLGISAGGFGAASIAMKHRERFGAIAAIAGPLNLRYDNVQERYSDDFDPATYRERTEYDPDLIVARYYFRLVRRRVRTFIEPVYGSGPDVLAKIASDNPADLLASTGLRPGELAIYVNYPGRDNYNFDAHDQSFAWLAAQRGIAVDLVEIPNGRHNLPYIHRAMPLAFLWLGRHISPPVQR